MPEGYFSNSFEYLESDRQVTGIRIHQKGVYMVYSQVAMRGQIEELWVDKLECGHQTFVKRRSDKNDTILVKSLTSQINRGRPYEDSSSQNTRLYPLDTALQMGQVILEVGDIVEVQRPEACTTFNYYSDPNYTYFGLIKLHDLSSPSDPCN